MLDRAKVRLRLAADWLMRPIRKRPKDAADDRGRDHDEEDDLFEESPQGPPE